MVPGNLSCHAGDRIEAVARHMSPSPHSRVVTWRDSRKAPSFPSCLLQGDNPGWGGAV